MFIVCIALHVLLSATVADRHEAGKQLYDYSSPLEVNCMQVLCS